jgi:hypothetical protein
MDQRCQWENQRSPKLSTGRLTLTSKVPGCESNEATMTGEPPMNRRVLSDLLSVHRPGDLLHEVLHFCDLDKRPPEGSVVASAYQTAVRLYQGRFENYCGCDTAYHDFAHVAETFLAMARLLHGARLASESVSARDMAVGLTAAILHDAGYIRKSDESGETGAYYRSEHEERSMAFVSQHGAAIGLTRPEVRDCQSMIRGTIMAEDVNAMSFRSHATELLVRMLSNADLLAQLSSDTYLERLMFLFDEDRHSPRPHYRDLVDCYHRAISFDDLARSRLDRHLDQSETYLTKHFERRWDLSENLYRVAMDRQIQFLKSIVTRNGFAPRRHLRRWGSLQTQQQRMSESIPS